MGVLEGKAVLITGAANGIGRDCALLAAKEGARLVVNDLGASMSGRDEGSTSPIVQLVADLESIGGEVVANSESVADPQACERMVQQAVDSFGTLDAVINPAGILRDGMLHKMSHADWDAVIAVHLKGAFNLSRAAIGHFRENEGGAFVHFTSTSGLIGNLGQGNYAAAKMGVVGLSRSLSLEGAAKHIRSNVIAPFAWTRMIDSIPVKDEESARRVERMRNGMRAEQVAQLAIALAAPHCDASGQIFGVRGNEVMLFSQPRPTVSLARLEGWSPQSLLEQGLPAMSGRYVPIEPSAAVFPYDPV